VCIILLMWKWNVINIGCLNQIFEFSCRIRCWMNLIYGFILCKQLARSSLNGNWLKIFIYVKQSVPAYGKENQQFLVGRVLYFICSVHRVKSPKGLWMHLSRELNLDDKTAVFPSTVEFCEWAMLVILIIVLLACNELFTDTVRRSHVGFSIQQTRKSKICYYPEFFESAIAVDYWTKSCTFWLPSNNLLFILSLTKIGHFLSCIIYIWIWNTWRTAHSCNTWWAFKEGYFPFINGCF